jgi:YesN/AraC family two-component response regulator
MQGGLAVRNLPDQGAEFVVSLPLTRKALPAGVLLPAPVLVSPERSEETGPGPVASGNRPLLLLVEDNADVAQYTKTCIGEEYGIIQAADGLVGFNLALEKMPDIILSDVMMPLMDGFELCDKLKNDERTSHIPIILLTARAAASDRITGLRRGADAYLTKPFGREELLIVLSNLIKSRRLLQIHYSQLALGALHGNPLPMPAGLDEALEDQFLVKLRTTVEARLDNAELSADMISQLMGMSRNTLHRKMNALTGMSINPYVRTLRLQKAKELLLTPDLSIAEVAYAVGFEDPKYFSRIFSEEHGISPSTFRNLNKK